MEFLVGIIIPFPLQLVYTSRASDRLIQFSICHDSFFIFIPRNVVYYVPDLGTFRILFALFIQ